MRITQKEIASRVGVSVSLVSRVLSGSAGGIGVPDSTIQEVLRVSRELGYVPNRAAQALKGKSAKTVGVVVYDFKDPFFSDFVGILQEKFHEIGYSIVLVGFHERTFEERDLSPLHQHFLDAIIVLGSDPSPFLPATARIAPVFRIGHVSSEENSAVYAPDEAACAMDLAAHLSQAGVHRVSLFHNDLLAHTRRISYFHPALESNGCRVTRHAFQSPSVFEGAVQLARSVLDLQNLPDAIVCTTDQIAIAVMKYLQSRGIRLPRDTRLIGFDDISLSRQIHPGLTTFAQPIGTLVETIIERLHGKDFDPGHNRFSCPLILRESG